MEKEQDKTGYYRETFYHKGKQYAVYGKTLKESVQKATIKKRMLERGEIGISENMTVNTWAKTWMETYKKGSNGTKSYANISAKMKTAILPAIGQMRLKDVTEIHLQQIVNSRKGNSSSDISKVMQAIKGMFRQARSSRLIAHAPSEGINR